MNTLVSFVIASHNRASFLKECLDSCAAQQHVSKEIIVVLNPPDPDSESVVKQFHTHAICTHRNLGAFPAKSIGIANATASYIMVVDDDAKFLAPDDVSRMLQTLMENPRIAAVTCNTVGPCEGRPVSETQEVPLYKDGFTLYRRSVFAEIAGFVPDVFFRAGGETYYANYIYDRGYSVVRRHDVTMFHAQTSVGRSRSAMNRFAVRNHALLVLLQEPARVVPFSLGWKLLTSAWRIAARRADPMNWLLGWLSFIALIPFGLANRRPISWATYSSLRQMRRRLGLGGPIIKMSSGKTPT